MISNEVKNVMFYVEEITKNLGDALLSNDYCIEDEGCPHYQPIMPKNTIAIYIFAYKKNDTFEFLKIGKANSKSQARFTSQHYGFSAPSTLAKSICADNEFIDLGVNPNNVKSWILNNLYRVNILINADKGNAITELVESILHYKFRPRYEGNI